MDGFHGRVNFQCNRVENARQSMFGLRYSLVSLVPELRETVNGLLSSPSSLNWLQVPKQRSLTAGDYDRDILIQARIGG
jgi:hypothetical protein